MITTEFEHAFWAEFMSTGSRMTKYTLIFVHEEGEGEDGEDPEGGAEVQQL